jgi:hypothetical protein
VSHGGEYAGSRSLVGPEEAPHQDPVNGISGSGMSHSILHERARSGRSGSLAGLRLCMVMHVGNSEGSRAWQGCWAAAQIGESAHPGQRVSAKDRSTGRPRSP